MIQATIAHAELMAAIHGAAFPHDPWDAASFATLLAQPGVTGLIDPRGGIILMRQAADEAEIITLAAARPRTGIGRALMRAAMAHAKDATVMHLEVAANNAPALALYATLGFKQSGRRKAYYPNGQDAIVLTAPLNTEATNPDTVIASGAKQSRFDGKA